MDRDRLGSWTCPGSPGSPSGAPPWPGPEIRVPEISGNFPGPGRAGPGRGPPGGRAGEPQKWAQNGPFLGLTTHYLVLLNPLFGGVPRGCPFWAPRGAPGGAKSAHFFGYLITLPVGTVWATFFQPRFWGVTPGIGGIRRFGQCLWDPMGLWNPPPCAASCAWDWIVREAV